MSDVEEVNFEADIKPVKPAKTVKKKKPAKAAAKAAEPRVPFPGLTRTACAQTCTAAACAISGKPYCAHPTKGGLQSTDSENRPAMVRLQEARDQIGVRVDPERFK